MRGGTFPDSEQAPHTDMLAPSSQQKSKNAFRGLADHPPVPSQEQAGLQGGRAKFLTPAVYSGEEGGGGQSLQQPPPLLPRLGQQKHLLGVWRLSAQTSCWESRATKRSGSGCQGKLCSLGAGMQGRPLPPAPAMAQGLPLLATGPGLQGAKAARA